jgi:hypothetical protein
MSQELVCNSTNIVRLAAETPICTHEQLAAMEFKPESYFVGFDKNPKAMEEHEDKLRAASVMSRFAVVTLGKTKEELIETVRSMDKDRDPEASSGNFLMWLTDGREKVEALLAFMTAAEVRFACACACVYPDDDERGPPLPKPPAKTLGGRKKRHLKPVN